MIIMQLKQRETGKDTKMITHAKVRNHRERKIYEKIRNHEKGEKTSMEI